MIPCVVFDFQTLGALALAAVLIATVYLVYRDIRMIMQMVNDLREEFMMLQMSCQQTSDGEDDEEEDAASEEEDGSEVDEDASEDIGDVDLNQDEVDDEQKEELRENLADESKVEAAEEPNGVEEQVLRNLTGTQKGRGRGRGRQAQPTDISV